MLMSFYSFIPKKEKQKTFLSFYTPFLNLLRANFKKPTLLMVN